MSRDQHPTPIERTLYGMRHSSPSKIVQDDLITIRRHYQQLVIEVGKTVMEQRCQALVLTKLEEALMWSTKGIVLAEAIGNDLKAEARGG